MPENAKKPQIRFKGFTDVWEQRKLGDCFAERNESMPEGELISVTINEGIKKFSELGRHNNSNEDKTKYKKVCISDIAYNSMRMWQGASGYSPYEGIVSPAYTVLVPNAGIDSKCLSYQIKLPYMIHIFQINSQGITSDNWNLKYPVLSQIEIFISKNIEEQRKISNLFDNLDNLITLHQRKLDKLKNIKKSMLEKMFPKNGSNVPEIRFKGFTDAWEQRKLEKLCSEFKSGESIKNENIKETGSYPVYGGNGLRGYTETYNHNGNFALIGRQGALCGNMNYSSGKAYFTEHAIAVAANAENCTQFLFYLLQLMNLGQYSDQSAQPGLAVNKLTKLETLVPLKKEQKKIRKIFNNLDNLITLHQRKLEKLQNIKKACLEKMFV